MSNVKDKEYFEAVIDVCKLVLKWTTIEKASIQDIIQRGLEQIEIEIENKNSRHSPLYELLELNTDQSHEQSRYWIGVRDCTNLIRNYFSWRQGAVKNEEFSSFLQTVLYKATTKIQPSSSPLIETLGIDFASLPKRPIFTEPKQNLEDNKDRFNVDTKDKKLLFDEQKTIKSVASSSEKTNNLDVTKIEPSSSAQAKIYKTDSSQDYDNRSSSSVLLSNLQEDKEVSKTASRDPTESTNNLITNEEHKDNDDTLSVNLKEALKMLRSIKDTDEE